MWVRNPSKVDARLVRSHVTDELAVGALVVRQAYQITEGGLVPLADPPKPAPHDPPDTSGYVRWAGVSVTVAGHVHGPTKPPFARLVQLRVGEALRKMAVFGDRVWEKSILGGLGPSEPRSFDRLELSVQRAFGGGFDVPPGLLQIRGLEELPHPGYRHDHLLNPRGVGVYSDERAATGAPLPNFERPEALLERWNDSPEPVAFSPCPELLGWRGRALVARYVEEHKERFAGGGVPTDLPPPAPSSRIVHHAPPELIFDAVPVGTIIEVEGLSAGRVRLSVPPCRARLAVEPVSKAGSVLEPAARLRSIHVDTDRGLCLVVHGLSFRYHPRRAPKGVRVSRVEGVFA
jgi:hypothetical protein